MDFFKRKREEFSEKGTLGYILAFLFFAFMLVIYLSPLWMLLGGFYIMMLIID